MTNGIFVYDSIDLFRCHACFDIFFYFVQNCRIDLTGLSNTCDLFRSFDHLPVRHFVTGLAVQFDFSVYFAVTVGISFAAAAPA